MLINTADHADICCKKESRLQGDVKDVTIGMFYNDNTKTFNKFYN
jgi:hypothetical protein